MKKFTKSIPVFLLCLFSSVLLAQDVVLDSANVSNNLRRHIKTLASDKFKGRETGTKGELLAAKYIVNEFQNIGLEAMGDRGLFEQEFTFTAGIVYGKNNALSVVGKKYKLDKEYYPLPYSANGSVTAEIVFVGYGISAPKMDYSDYSDTMHLNGKIFLMEISSPDGMSPHSKYAEYSDLRQKIDTAIARGAGGIIFINNDTTAENPAKRNLVMKIAPSSVPVVFCTKDLKGVLQKNPKCMASIGAELVKVERTGHNIVGFIDNRSKTTVVIGAHYDHLGMGEEGSLYRGKPAIHNGADDNASGTAALIEVARYLKKQKNPMNNYMIIAFSGEEKGLYGSSHFVKQPTAALASTNYMINMDMVGRLNPDKILIINGVGTSPEWLPVLNRIEVDGIKIKTSESGIGPSDQTSFYLKDIPSIHFFTGSHSDYHKPSDDENKINYIGEASVLKYVLTVIENMNDKGKIAFAKTKDDKNEDTPRFKVTLGVVPDYAYEGEGLRIDGISDGKSASKAGLKSGDIVVQMGENKITDMMSYMKSLGKFMKGDETTVKVKRGAEILDFKVKF